MTPTEPARETPRTDAFLESLSDLADYQMIAHKACEFAVTLELENAQLREEIEAVKAERDKMREYAQQHKFGCASSLSVDNECTCGLAELLK